MNEASHQILAEHYPNKVGCSLEETLINTYKRLHSGNAFFSLCVKRLLNNVEQKKRDKLADIY
jgi:hypothetical protein